MSRFLPILVAVLIAIRPLSGCCECHAPLATAAIEIWHDLFAGDHGEDCCDHSAPCQTPEHSHGKCPSCESTQDFVKVATSRMAKASPTWHFAAPLAAAVTANSWQAVACLRSDSGVPPLGDLRAHLLCGVLLI